MSKPKSVQVGVFIPGDAQLLDMACIDVLHIMSKEYLSLLPIPAHMIDLAPSVAIHYITSSPKEPMMIPLTSNVMIRATHDMSHPDVQPGALDILLVPGPDPSSTWEKPVLDFLAGHARHEGTDVLCVCTGILLCGAAGIIDGKTVSGPRGMVDEIKRKHPTAKLVGDQYRWVQDGNFWSSGKCSLFDPRLDVY
jgi:putative intracellular protease/amidase